MNIKCYSIMRGNLRIFATMILFTIVTLFFAFSANRELNIYVSPTGNDFNNGSLQSPLRTIEKAAELVRSAQNDIGYSKINVNLRSGNYFISKPIVLLPNDGGSAQCAIEYKAYQNEIPVIAGAKLITQKWTKVDKNGNLWKIKLGTSDTINGKLPTQLFVNGRRLTRCSSPVMFTLGPIQQFYSIMGNIQKQHQPEKFLACDALKKNNLLPFCSFSYKKGEVDLDPADINNAEIVLYHSWDCSRHDVAQIDKNNGNIYLKSPSYYPIGFFSNRNRFVIENCKKYLKNEGDWYYDKNTNEIWYMSDTKTNPNALKFIIPQTQRLLVLKGDQLTNKPIQNVKFTGIHFKYTVAPRGINVDTKLYGTAAGRNVPWIQSNTGFSGIQGDVECGQAVWLQNAEHVQFLNCTFSQLGNYALRIDKFSNENNVINCSFFDLGGGGIILGYNNSRPSAVGIPQSASPSGNVILNCKIHDIGLIYPSSLAIGIMNAVKSNISSNEVYNTPYSGISCGFTYGFGISYTNGNTIQKNKIHDVMKLLADGGGIYTLGTQPNTLITGNIIYNINRNKDATGAFNNGIFFDEGSSEMMVDKNIIYNIGNSKFRYNKTDSAKIRWGTNILK